MGAELGKGFAADAGGLVMLCGQQGAWLHGSELSTLLWVLSTQHRISVVSQNHGMV